MEANTTTTATAAPAVTNEKRVDIHHQNSHVLRTPLWITIVRAFQILVSLIVLGLAARLMHDAYLDEEGLALAVSLITWAVVAYIVLTEKITSWHGAYHIIAVLCLDGLLMVLWLATFAAVAAERARYKYRTTVNACFDDGSIFDSKFCVRKRQLEKRDDDVLLFKSGAAMLTSIAGLGALVWLLTIATFVWTLVMFIRGRKQGHFPLGSGNTPIDTENHQMESKPVDPNQLNVAHPPPQAYQNQMGIQQPQPTYAPSQSPYPQPVSPQPSSGPYSPPVGAYSPEGQPQQPTHGQPLPQHQQAPAAYPQQGYQPPSSPSPLDQTQQHHQSYVSQSSASPPPQELHPDPYQPQPQEMPVAHNQQTVQHQ